ncbi:helix-turn-helix domain-containing protein [Thalassotalea castellviae]|uniref:AraC family transcriptional regulator n=1 Tax=Thalassotalea castellviae TaxID=3075612 RepID=A0ABU3A2X5_9GAMM|nr:AraC family transcriptional regulator [Thalassotalea sp. W431]MDT0603917.1 AraC family transcriptional regulator [Thalassotalea sp. W431]
MTIDSNLETLPPISVLHREIPALAGINKYQHHQTQCIYVHSGVLAIITEHGRYFIPPQQAIIIPDELIHELLAKTEVKLSIFYFIAEESTHLPTHPQVITVDPLLTALMNESLQISNDYLWESSDGRLLRLIRDKLSQAKVLDTFLPYPKDSRLTNITERLLKHPSLKSDLNFWGKFVNASPRTLSRVFKKETNITYSEWRQRLNIQITIKHLSLGDSINSIAELLGYESSSAFIYMFRKQMGVSPSQFLKN